MARKRPVLSLDSSPSPAEEPKGISIDEITKLAEEADRLAQSGPEEPKRKRAKKREQPEGEAVDETPKLEYDPEFEMMLTFAVGSGVDELKKRFDWTEPGMHWREKVGACVSRLIQRIQPMTPGPMADLITLTGYLAVWSIPNVTVNGTTQSQSVIRNDGKRKDLQNEGTAQQGT